MNGSTKVRLASACCVFVALAFVIRAQTVAKELRLIEIDPAHPHISSLHNQSLPGVSDEVHVYSPLTPELAAHLAALSRFNNRPVNPTHWTVRLFAGPDYLSQFIKEPPGNIVALSGANQRKIDYVLQTLQAGQNVFADKPWIIASSDLSKLETALDLAREKGLITYDWMTLRGNRTYRLQRDLVLDPGVFGEPAAGAADRPSVRLENLHALLKFSNGVPQQRPPSFLDVRQQGEGMADVGTHLADLVQWTLSPRQAIDYRRDIKVLTAHHSPLTLTLDQFTRLTGQSAWPDYLRSDLVENQLRYFANGSCLYTLRGIFVQLKVNWQFQAQPGAQDSYFVSYRGTKAVVELKAGVNEKYLPEIYITPEPGIDSAAYEATLKGSLARLSHTYPNLSYKRSGQSFHVLVPASDHRGDDLHTIFEEFAGYVRDPSSFPESENANMLAKYYLTTTAVTMAQTQP
jgi:predicted dehydrogenase